MKQTYAKYLMVAALTGGFLFTSCRTARETTAQYEVTKGEFYQFNLSSCIRQQNSLTAQFVSFSLSNLANIFYPPQFLQ